MHVLFYLIEFFAPKVNILAIFGTIIQLLDKKSEMTFYLKYVSR